MMKQLLLLAVLLGGLILAGCGSDTHQTNTITIDGTANDVAVQICGSGDCRQSNSYNGGYATGGGDDGSGEIMAFAVLVCAALALILIPLGLGALVSNIEFRT